MRLSILVVSRSADLLSAMLSSIKEALHLPGREVEILCSWNGSAEEEALIENSSGYGFFIANRTAYHFASNMNQLAHHANGEVLAFVNDDVILDKNSLDSGLSCLMDDVSTLSVGGLLRKPDGRLQHCGMGFDYQHMPYHIAEGMANAATLISGLPAYEVSCVTGAVMLVRKSTFNQQPFDESYIRCGEDVQLNLDLREKLKGKVMLCPGMSGVHKESATRKKAGETGNSSEDLVRMKTRRRLFLEKATPEQLRAELSITTKERLFTKEAMDEERSHLLQLEQERDHWKQQTHALQLARLKLEQKLKQSKQGA